MDTSFNETDYFEEEIRAPDEIKREQLLRNIRDDYDREMSEALHISMQEAREREIQNLKFEEEIISKYNSEMAERREKFNELLLNMNKLCKFDKDIKEVYDLIEPIIEAYCCDFIKYFEIDEETYNKIFNTLGTIRVKKNTLEILKIIIIKNP
jgi:hypothetical protein